jgi:hypothetical protein
MLRNSRGLTRCFFFNLESWWFSKIITLYTIIFCSDCTRVWIALLSLRYLTLRGAECSHCDVLVSHSCLFSFRWPVLWMFHFQSTQLGPKWTWLLTVIFASCNWRIKSRTNILRNFLSVIFLSHDLCNRYAFSGS